MGLKALAVYFLFVYVFFSAMFLTACVFRLDDKLIQANEDVLKWYAKTIAR